MLHKLSSRQKKQSRDKVRKGLEGAVPAPGSDQGNIETMGLFLKSGRQEGKNYPSVKDGGG